MLKLYEVFSQTEKLACLDVTENNKAERADIMANLKVLYGADCQYYEHDCGHAEHKPCTSKAI